MYFLSLLYFLLLTRLDGDIVKVDIYPTATNCQGCIVSNLLPSDTCYFNDDNPFRIVLNDSHAIVTEFNDQDCAVYNSTEVRPLDECFTDSTMVCGDEPSCSATFYNYTADVNAYPLKATYYKGLNCLSGSDHFDTYYDYFECCQGVSYALEDGVFYMSLYFDADCTIDFIKMPIQSGSCLNTDDHSFKFVYDSASFATINIVVLLFFLITTLTF